MKSKVIFFGKGDTKHDKDDKSRMTLQLRAYDENGQYDNNVETSTATVWIKNIKDVDKVNEIIKNALMNSKYLDEYFEVE